MISKHGTLESAILSTLWSLEEKGKYKNSVQDVYSELIRENKKAYTTIKTVMDRLYQKNVLLRFKEGRKFYYKCAYSSQEIITKSLQDIANRYCCGDIDKLAFVLNNISETRQQIEA